MADIKEIQKQEFDFTDKLNLRELNKWKRGVKAIPMPKKSFWLDGLILDDEDLAEVYFTATYQFIAVGHDNWFWLNVLFKKGGTALVSFFCSYSTREEYRWLPGVNQFLKQIGFDETDELSVLPERELVTWQEGYDLLCDIARKTKVPKFEK
ncbi:MAG: hypothetical protein KBB86_02790 [Candidatus Pacebacteria bacterium]|nr:hypothetical protein [Candidatus Paceibacterota bacterium]